MYINLTKETSGILVGPTDFVGCVGSINLPYYVCLSVFSGLFSKTSHQIFLILRKKVTKPDFLQIIWFSGKSVQSVKIW